MNSQITKDTKFKDLPDSIKARLVLLTKKTKPLASTNGHTINNFSSICAKMSSLDLYGLKETFEQSVANCEAFKEGVEVKIEDVQKNVEMEITEMKNRIHLFKESQNDDDILGAMYEAIKMLQRRAEKNTTD